MSEVKVNKISPRTACGTVTLGDSGDTFTIPAGATITNSGTAAGFGATGAASWDTTVKTTGFTAVSGVGYFVNTTGGAITVTLPASPSAGDVVAVSDYAGTADTNNITIGRNSSNINGAAADLTISYENSAITLVYVDGTQGWKATDTSSLSDIELQPEYVTATGGTPTTSPCGDYKIHTFTGPGTFCVSCAGNAGGSNTVDYLVVAGGGSGGGRYGGGGGGGGFREGYNPGSYTASPLATIALPVSVQGYGVVIGGGGPQPATDVPGNECGSAAGTKGSNSVFSTITSTGGGGGAGQGNGCSAVQNGGSGGGSDYTTGNQGTGNTPPVSPPQGQPGGANGTCGASPYTTGGGGGATVAGVTSTPSNPGAGGAGATSSINGTPTARAGGGGGGGSVHVPVGGSPGGAGGGGNGGSVAGARTCAGTVNTGGGGGGGYGNPGMGGAGGSGIVIIRYKFQN